MILIVVFRAMDLRLGIKVIVGYSKFAIIPYIAGQALIFWAYSSSFRFIMTIVIDILVMTFCDSSFHIKK